MSIKLVCHGAQFEKDTIELEISDLEKDGYIFRTAIPVFSNQQVPYADICIILEKPKNTSPTTDTFGQ